MILKASQRGGARQLANHLTNEEDNQHVELYDLRGFIADDLDGALVEVMSQSLLQVKLALSVDAIIQRMQQIVGMLFGWFCRTDVSGSYVLSQFPAALLKLNRTI